MIDGHNQPKRVDLTTELVETLAGVLASDANVQFAYLFGSVAKGRTRANSDVDVAVHLSGGETPSERLDQGLDLEGRLEEVTARPVQIAVLNDAPLELRFNVLHHGIPLHTRDPAARSRFYVETGRRYYDMAQARELFRRRQLERIREGTFGG